MIYPPKPTTSVRHAVGDALRSWLHATNRVLDARHADKPVKISPHDMREFEEYLVAQARDVVRRLERNYGSVKLVDADQVVNP